MYKTISVLLLATMGAWIGGSEAVTKLTYPKIVAQVALTNQTDSIPETTVIKPTKSGLYRISVYMVQVFPVTSPCTGNDCATANAYFQWTDDGVGSANPQSLGLTITLEAASGHNDSCASHDNGNCNPLQVYGVPGAVFLVRVNADTPLMYSVSYSPQNGGGVAYDYFMTVEQLE